MSTFTPPIPPTDLRRDIEALNLYHPKCTSKPIKDVTTNLLHALENSEPIVNRQSTVYTTFRNHMDGYLTKISNKHDADANRWYFHSLRREFRLVRDQLYGTARDAAAAAVRNASTGTNIAGVTAGNAVDGDTDGTALATDEGSENPAVDRPGALIHTGRNVSARMDGARAHTVSNTSSVPRLTKSKVKPSKRSTRSNKLLDSDTTEAARKGEVENMHHTPKRGPGDEFRGGAVDPEKAHLPIGERELPDHNEKPVVAEELSYERDETERKIEEAGL